MVPGSHNWDSKRVPTPDQAVPVVGKPGTVVYVYNTPQTQEERQR